jgi:hypothetical protein
MNPSTKGELGKTAAIATTRSASIELSSPNFPIIDFPPVANVRRNFWIF